MKTIKEHLFHRLSLQAQESDHLGLTKVASALTAQVESNAQSVRSDEQMYRYAKEEFKDDLNHALWGAVVRMADFYDVSGFDPVKTQEMIERTASSIVREFCAQNQIDHGVGAYEPSVVGEELNQVILEVE